MTKIWAENLSIEYPIYGRSITSAAKTLMRNPVKQRVVARTEGGFSVNALRNLSFRISDGDRVGLLGANGAGKSTLLKVLAGVLTPTSGRLLVDGKVASLLTISLGLNHEATGRENIYLRGLYLNLSPKTMDSHIDEIIEFSGLGEFIELPVRTYSSGMILRLCFAVSTALRADILLLDEWLYVGDHVFMERARERVLNFLGRSSIAVIASHSLDLLKTWCKSGIVLDKGYIVGSGPIDEMIELHKASESR